MALIRFPEGQQRSGSSGGIVYSRNRFGAYIRPRSVPVNPNTARQITNRLFFTQAVTAWVQTLTAVERESWNIYAQNIQWTNPLGDPTNLSGQQHFIRSSVGRLNAGLAILPTAPGIFDLGDPPAGLSAVADVGDQDIDVAFDNTAEWANEVGGAMTVYQGPPINPSLTFFEGPWRKLGEVLGAATPPTSPATFPAQYNIIANAQYFLLARAVRADGRLSSSLKVGFLSVP